jgi:pyruvate kinase
MSTDEAALRRMAFYHGVMPVKLEEIRSFDETLDLMVETAQKKANLNSNGWIVLTAGHPIFQVSHTNMVKVHFLG